MTCAPNEAQADYWNAARHWIDGADAHDAMLEPLGAPAMQALAVTSGERVLEVGCGTGAATRLLAAQASPGGEAVGVDISALLLGLARERSAGIEGASFIEADVQTYPFVDGSFDAAFSRFGVMFFDDPVAAFANVRRALRTGGRLGFVCWQHAALNEWMAVPARAARPWLDVQLGPDAAPGPFAFGSPARLRSILGDAGFQEVVLDDVRRPVLIGGPGDVDTALAFLAASRLGRQIREGTSDPDAAFAAVREALTAFETQHGVEMTAAVWVVTARS